MNSSPWDNVIPPVLWLIAILPECDTVIEVAEQDVEYVGEFCFSKVLGEICISPYKYDLCVTRILPLIFLFTVFVHQQGRIVLTEYAIIPATIATISLPNVNPARTVSLQAPELCL